MNLNETTSYCEDIVMFIFKTRMSELGAQRASTALAPSNSLQQLILEFN